MGHVVLLDMTALVPDDVRLPGRVTLVRAKAPPTRPTWARARCSCAPTATSAGAADDAEA